MAEQRFDSDKELIKDIEKGQTNDEEEKTIMPQGIEKTTLYYQKSECSQSTIQKSSLNILKDTDESSKVIEKNLLVVDSPEKDGNDTESETLSEADSIETEVNKDIMKFAAVAVRNSALIAKRMSSTSSVFRNKNFRDVEIGESSGLSNIGNNEREERRQRGSEGDADSVKSSTSEESTNSTLKSCEVARAAAERARNEAVECFKILAITEKVVAAAQRCVESAQGNIASAEPREFSPHHDLVERYNAVICSINKRAKRLQVIASSLESTALHADTAADKAFEVADEVSFEAKKKKFMACWATNSADAACSVAYKIEYGVLKILRTHWEQLLCELDTQEDDDDDNSYDGRNQECVDRKRKTTVAHIGSLFLGVVVLGSLPLFKVGTDSFYAVLCIGVVIFGWSSVYWLHKLYRFCKPLPTVVRRPKILDEIDERLNILEECLKNKNITPPPSESLSDTESWVTVNDPDDLEG